MGGAGDDSERGHDCMLPEEQLPQLETAIVEHILAQVAPPPPRLSQAAVSRAAELSVTSAVLSW